MRKSVLFFLIVCLSALYAQISFTDTDFRITRTLFGGNWLQADSLINQEIQKQPEHPKYHFFKAYNCFYGRYVSASGLDRDTIINRVRRLSNKTIEIGENLDETPEIKFYLGNTYALLSRVDVMEQEFWDAYWNASESENYLEDLIDEYPSFYDSYLNLGVMEYFPDVMVTGFRGFLVWLGGMSGDREVGLQYFDYVADKGSIFKDEAKYIQGLIFGFREDNTRKAFDSWNYLSMKYPDNQMYQGQRDRAHLYLTIEEKGIGFLDDEFNQLEEKYNITNAGLLNTFGYTLMSRERLDEALKVFQTNVRLYPHVANCYDSMAECYVNRGENSQAIKYYKVAYEKLESDTTINDRFRQNLREGIEERLSDLGSGI